MGQIKIHSWYIKSLVKFLALTQLSINYYEWIMLEKLAPNLLVSKPDISFIFYFIVFLIHYIKKFYSNIYLRYIKKNPAATCHLETLIVLSLSI